MTYCVGVLVRDGLVMVSDTRTNAGLDNVSAYRKLHIFERPGERLIAVATAGSLSLTQTTLSLLREGVPNPDSGELEVLEQAPTLFRAAQLVGHALRLVRAEHVPAMRAERVNTEVSFLVGGQVAGQPMRLFLVYNAGNFIECGPDTPFLQIGEYKYGKPILDRALMYDTDPMDALKLGLLSVDATIRSNLGVGLPLDVMVLRKDALLAETRCRIPVDDPYFRDLGERWGAALSAAHQAIPRPDYG
jgi:putative proteasome-type protease